MNLFKYLELLTELMYLCLNKLASMDKELCLFIYIRCRRLEESHFPIHL